MRTPVKYLLFQVPGWLLAAVVLYGARYWFDLPLWVTIGAFALWVLKDFVFYPLLRVAYESGTKSGVEQLIGLRGVAREDLTPRGYVRVRGELWRAETEAGGGPIGAGEPVRVVGVNGMTLIVAYDGADKTGSLPSRDPRA